MSKDSETAIVERLRAAAWYKRANGDDELMREAADEIQRLTETLTAIAGWWDLMKQPSHEGSAVPYRSLDLIISGLDSGRNKERCEGEA